MNGDAGPAGAGAKTASTGMPAPRGWLGGRRGALVATALLALLLACAYGNSLRAPFVLDDMPNIVNNAALHEGSPVTWRLAEQPRRLVAATFALDWRLGGENPLGYHLVNLAIHLLNGLLAFVLLRRVFASQRLASSLGDAGPSLALLAAGIFIAHPLQPQAVTYVVQRCESLMATFALLALWCVSRAGEPGARPRAWACLAAMACALGSSCKETAVAVPPLMMVFDRIFVASSWSEVRSRRGALHLAAAATTLLVIALDVAATRHSARDHVSSLYGAAATPWTYLLTEAGVVAHYLALVAWPAHPCFDYMWPLATGWRDALPGGAVVIAALAATGLALWRAPAAGFAALAFFAILAPTSSVLPIADPAFDHRLYLPVLAAAALAVCGLHCGARALGGPRAATGVAAALAIIAVGALAARTQLRNRDFATSESIWRATLEVRPDNARALVNLGCAQSEAGRLDQAIANFERALALKPDFVNAHVQLGSSLVFQGRLDEGGAHLRRAVAEDPSDQRALAALGQWLQRTGDLAGAERAFRASLAIEPGQATALVGVAILRYRAGDLAGAEALARAVAAMTVGSETANAWALIGAIARDQNRLPVALDALERAVALDGSHQGARTMLALTYAGLGRRDDARRAIVLALAIDPTNAFALEAQRLINDGGGP